MYYSFSVNNRSFYVLFYLLSRKATHIGLESYRIFKKVQNEKRRKPRGHRRCLAGSGLRSSLSFLGLLLPWGPHTGVLGPQPVLISPLSSSSRRERRALKERKGDEWTRPLGPPS